MKLTQEKASRIFDLLVNIGGASSSDKDNFIYHHSKDDSCTEWRFCGHFGYGGKYRSKSNSVDYYIEDETKEREEILNRLNNELANLT